MRRTCLALCLLAAGSTLAVAATDDELRQQIVGSWGETAACADASLVFSADGGFVLARAGEDPASLPAGSYKIEGGILSGATPEGAMPDVTVRIDDTKLYFEQDGQVVNELTRCAS